MSSKHIVSFAPVLGKDRVYVNADCVQAICFQEAVQQSPINGMATKRAVTQIILNGGAVFTVDKIDTVRRKLGWTGWELPSADHNEDEESAMG